MAFLPRTFSEGRHGHSDLGRWLAPALSMGCKKSELQYTPAWEEMWKGSQPPFLHHFCPFSAYRSCWLSGGVVVGALKNQTNLKTNISEENQTYLKLYLYVHVWQVLTWSPLRCIVWENPKGFHPPNKKTITRFCSPFVQPPISQNHPYPKIVSQEIDRSTVLTLKMSETHEHMHICLKHINLPKVKNPTRKL